jgi:hypothetical protein
LFRLLLLSHLEPEAVEAATSLVSAVVVAEWQPSQSVTTRAVLVGISLAISPNQVVAVVADIMLTDLLPAAVDAVLKRRTM